MPSVMVWNKHTHRAFEHIFHENTKGRWLQDVTSWARLRRSVTLQHENYAGASRLRCGNLTALVTSRDIILK